MPFLQFGLPAILTLTSAYLQLYCFIFKLWEFCPPQLSFWVFACPSHKTCGILVPQPGVEPWPLAVKASSPNHWINREFSYLFISNIHSFTWLCLILVPAQGLFSLHCSMWEAGFLIVTCGIFSCSMWDPIPPPGNELGCPNLGALSLTTGLQGCPSHDRT